MTVQKLHKIAPEVFVLILLSLLLFGWRAIGALQAGALLPAYIFLGAAALVIVAYLARTHWLAKVAVRIWGVFLMLFAAIRITIGLAARFDAIDSAHVRDATSVVYFLISILLFAIGLRLCSMRLSQA